MATNQADQARTAWRKSTHSGGNGDCVEIAEIDARCAVRDSKNPDGQILTFGRSEWSAFIGRIKKHHHDS
jgi:Domain of unknown function (DUF397)